MNTNLFRLQDRLSLTLPVWLIFVFLSAYYLLWALVTPPFQLPDEFAHNDRLSAMTSGDFLGTTKASKKQYVNPMAEHPALGSLPFNAQYGYPPEAITSIKALDRFANGPDIAIKNCCAGNYPPMFYLSLVVPKIVMQYAGVKPHIEHTILRMLVVLIVTCLWTIAYVEAKKRGIARAALFAAVVPSVAFMSTGINPDAFFYPISFLYLIYLIEAIQFRQFRYSHLLVSLSLPLVKIFGLFLLLAGACALAWVAFRSRTVMKVRYAFFSLIAPGLAMGAIWYSVTGISHESQPVQSLGWSQLPDYFANFDWAWLGKTMFGYFGWLDTPMQNSTYLGALLIIVAILVLSIFGVSRSKPAVQSDERFIGRLDLEAIAIVALAFACAIFLMDAYLSRYHGRVIQGRYLLPSVFSALIIFSYLGTLRKRLLAAWLVLSSLGIFVCLDRYYAGSWQIASMTLPMRMPHKLPVKISGVIPIELTKPQLQQLISGAAGQIDSTTQIGFHKYQFEGWYDGTRGQLPIRKFFVFSSDVQILRINSTRIERFDLAKLDSRLKQHGFRLTVDGFKVSNKTNPQLCIYVDVGTGVELVNQSGDVAQCKLVR